MFASPKFCYKCTTTIIQHLYYTSRETLSSNLPNSESESPSESSSRKKNPSSNRSDICFCDGGLYSSSSDSGHLQLLVFLFLYVLGGSLCVPVYHFNVDPCL